MPPDKICTITVVKVCKIRPSWYGNSTSVVLFFIHSFSMVIYIQEYKMSKEEQLKQYWQILYLDNWRIKWTVTMFVYPCWKNWLQNIKFLCTVEIESPDQVCIAWQGSLLIFCTSDTPECNSVISEIRRVLFCVMWFKWYIFFIFQFFPQLNKVVRGMKQTVQRYVTRRCVPVSTGIDTSQNADYFSEILIKDFSWSAIFDLKVMDTLYCVNIAV